MLFTSKIYAILIVRTRIYYISRQYHSNTIVLHPMYVFLHHYYRVHSFRRLNHNKYLRALFMRNMSREMLFDDWKLIQVSVSRATCNFLATSIRQRWSIRVNSGQVGLLNCSSHSICAHGRTYGCTYASIIFTTLHHMCFTQFGCMIKAHIYESGVFMTEFQKISFRWQGRCNALRQTHFVYNNHAQEGAIERYTRVMW